MGSSFWTRKINLWVLLILLGGCTTVQGGSSYRVTMPELEAPPMIVNCTMQSPTGPKVGQCVIIWRPDYTEIIVELKAACVGLGGSEEECQVSSEEQ